VLVFVLGGIAKRIYSGVDDMEPARPRAARNPTSG
jgi:hypothetical protein